MRDYLDIIKRNLLSPIVVVIFLLAGALVYVREYRDAWFISVVIVVNSTIGIIQELRAKRVLRQLELMSAPKARLLKDGNVVEVGYDELKIGDEILIDISRHFSLQKSKPRQDYTAPKFYKNANLHP
jgi:cation-transporting P-type ATPase E